MYRYCMSCRASSERVRVGEDSEAKTNKIKL